MIRWLKFNAVGIIGAGVQLAVLWLLSRAGVHYLLATAIAVEMAVLHNYAWHVRWTWADRPDRLSLRTLARLHAANGLVSIVSNVVLMRILAGWAGIPVLPANLLAIGITSILNFALGDHWVFVRRAP